MIQLVGPTGVGKSRLMAELKNCICSVYHEFTHFDDWANDKRKKLKILFIDESNIENKHLSLFNCLKKRGECKVLYKGKCYQLDENHKVVFAHNSVDYGSGRVQQKLFADGSIPEIHLVDFPAYYLYEAIMKPIYLAAHVNWMMMPYKKLVCSI